MSLHFGNGFIHSPLSDFNALALISLTGSGSSASTLTAPSGIQAGDLLLTTDVAFSSSNNSVTIPTGFTLLCFDVRILFGGYMKNALSYKIAAGTESGTTLNFSSRSDGYRALLVLRPNVPILGAVHKPTPWELEFSTASTFPDATIASAALAGNPRVVFSYWTNGTSGAGQATDLRCSLSPEDDGELFYATNTQTALKWKVFGSGDVASNVNVVNGAWSGAKWNARGWLELAFGD
jgi:hypothetical protein